MKKVCSLFIVLFITFSVYAALSGGEKSFLATHGMKNVAFYGDFVQTKGLKGSERTLKSGGIVEINPEKGIIWDTLKPYKSLLIITDNHITQKIRSNDPVRLDMNGNAVYTLISDSIRSVFFGDFSVMEENFSTNLVVGMDALKGNAPRSDGLSKNDVPAVKDSSLINDSSKNDMSSLKDFSSTVSVSSSSVADGTTPWILTLIPKDDVLSMFVKSIIVEGDREIKSVKLNESTGDYILYEFADLKEGEVNTKDVWEM